MAKQLTAGFKVKNLEKMLASKDEAVKSRVGLAIQRINQGAFAIQRTALKSMRDTSRQGKTVKNKRGIDHSPAKKGSPPAPDTGNLLKSTFVTVTNGDVIPWDQTPSVENLSKWDGKKRGAIATVISNATSEDGKFPYSVQLEFGGHPFMHPAFIANEKKIKQLVKRAIIKGV